VIVTLTTEKFWPRQRDGAQGGRSLLETVVTVAILMTASAIVLPNIMRTVYDMRLRSAANDLSGMMQQARILAARSNATYPIKFTIDAGLQAACVDFNNNGSCNAGEPVVTFSSGITPASGAPSGAGGQPSAYVLVGDTGTGAYNNSNTLAFSPRGLPCNYDASTTPATCTTPAAKYFVYYLTQTRPLGATGWGAVLVTKGGRTKSMLWNGTGWN
jgi:Tfp pilus assembly protein FimT